MNEIVRKLLLAGHTFMSEMQLRQPGFMYSACGLFTKKKTNEEYKKLSDKTFNNAKNPKYDGYQRGLASMVFKVFDKNFW